MGHRTITISDEAYRQLSKMKRERESFTDVVLRLASGKVNGKAVLEYIRGLPSSGELAEGVEIAMKRMRKASLAKATTG
jgi:predicted CopG family antitoxin